jgi:hypothetical protein
MPFYLSPTVSTVVSPLGEIMTVPIPTVTVTTAHIPNVDSGMNDNPMAQLQMRDYIHYKFLDKWLREDFYSCMSRLKISGGKVVVIKNESEIKNNDISKLSEDDLEKMADFIEHNILDKVTTKKIIIQILEESGLKWYELPTNERLVKHVMAHYVTNKLKKM